MKKIILIGGAPGIGKSYLARKIGEELKLPWISTDTVREMMRQIVIKEQYPELLHFGSEITAENYLSTHTAAQIMDSQNKESIDVWKGVKALIDTDYVWKDFVIEGIAILPEFISQIDSTTVNIKSIFLVDDNLKRIRDMVYSRGVWDDAKKYSDDVKEVEVEWVVLFNQWLQNETVKYGLNIEKIDDLAKTQKRIIQGIINWIED